MARGLIHPKEILAGELEELGLPASELAGIIKSPPNGIPHILSGGNPYFLPAPLEVEHLRLCCHVDEVRSAIQLHIREKIGLIQLPVFRTGGADAGLNLVFHQVW